MRSWGSALASTSICVLAVALAGAPALAQQTASADEGVNDIVVTARLRSENLQDVPVAVTVIGRAEIDQRQILDIEGLEAVTPNLVITPNTLTAGGANIWIRGIGVGDIDRSFSPAVQILIDDVRYGSGLSGQLVNTADVEQIEVLRGPQGTLFGANAIGGVIKITRPTPTDELTGRALVTLGSWGQTDFRGAIGGAIIPEKLQARIAVSSLNSDGMYLNEFKGVRRGFTDILAITPTVRFTPTENSEFILTYDYYRNRSDWGLLQNRSNSNDLMCLGILTGGVPLCDDPNRDLTTFNQDTETFLNIEGHALNFRFNIEAGDSVLSSITGWSSITEDKQTDFDGVPQPVFASIQPVKEEIFSQEFRFDWKPNEKLDLLFGLFGSVTNYVDGANSLFIFSILGFPPNTIEVVDRRQETTSLGAFVSATYRLTDQLSISAGGRYSWEEKDFIYRNGFNQSGGGFFPDADGFNNVARGTASWGQFTPRLGVEYKPNDDLLLYASFTQGFKSGGFNGRGNSEDTIGPYDPEKVNSYELGFKSDWADRKIRLNVAAFYADYQNKQEEIIRTNPDTGATITTVDNAAAVNIYGVEAEWTVLPFTGFTLSGTVAYLNAKYGEFISSGFDVADYVDVRNTPQWQLNFTARYDRDLTENLGLNTLIAYRWSDTYTPHLGPRFDGGGPSPLWNDPRATVNSFGILDASIGLRFRLGNGKEAQLLAFGKNITDEVFYNFFAPVANLWNMSGVSQRRQWGVQFGYNF
ncbi:MAG: TonB-dependent receptor [Sandaracinobacter sp.]